MEDLFKKFLYTGVGLVAMTTEKIQKSVDKLISDGKLSIEEGKKIIDKLVVVISMVKSTTIIIVSKYFIKNIINKNNLSVRYITYIPGDDKGIDNNFYVHTGADRRNWRNQSTP